MNIGISGSREGITDEALHLLKKFIKKNLKKNNILSVHHGDCVGADKIVHDLLCDKVATVVHPPNNDTMRAFCKSSDVRPPKPYLERNHEIVDEIDMLLAFPSTKNEIVRSGTWSTIRYAKKNNKKIIIFYPDGEREKIK